MTAGWVQSIHTMRRDERDLEVKEEKRIEMAIEMGLGDEMNTIPESVSNEVQVPAEGVETAQNRVTSPIVLDEVPKTEIPATEQEDDPKQIADFF